jgi:hypothetical protein
VPVEAPTPVPGRVSAAEREAVARRLRRGCEEERLSLDTFADRVERAFAASSAAELDALVADLPARRAFGSGVVAHLSSWIARLEAAWDSARLERLALPSSPGVYVFGRARDSDCVLPDPTVSRTHAWLRRDGDGHCWLRDLASSNGTWVNGRRVVDEVTVRPGDRISFGGLEYRLSAAL